MPEPTSRLRLLKQAPGSNFDSWGVQLNAGALDMTDEAFGVAAIAVGANVTLDVENYLSDEARRLVLHLTGAGGFTVTTPAVDKPYLVVNDCAADVTITPAGGTGAVVRAGVASWVWCDGTDAFVIDTPLDKIAAPEADVSLAGNKLTGVADPTDAQDGATKAYVDARRLDEIAAPTDAVSLNGQKIVNLATPTAASDAATFGFVQAEIAAAATINLPTVTGQDGKFLSTDGNVAFWDDVPTPEFASQAEAEAGTDETKFMNPLRTAQAIAELAPPPGLVPLGAPIEITTPVAAVDIVLPSGYDEYIIRTWNVRPVSSSDLQMRLSTDGGSSFASGASDYQTVHLYAQGTSIASEPTSQDRNHIQLARIVATGADPNGVSLEIRVIRPFDATHTTVFYSGYQAQNNFPANGQLALGTGIRRTNAATDTIRLLFATGDIAAGKIQLYGVNTGS